MTKFIVASLISAKILVLVLVTSQVTLSLAYELHEIASIQTHSITQRA